MHRYSLWRNLVPLVRTSRCLSDVASTGKSAPGESFGQDGVEEESPPRRVRSQASLDRSANRLSEKIRDADAQLQYTKSRIRRWKNRSAVMTDTEEVKLTDGVSRFSDAEFQRFVDEEEREYDERAIDMMTSLSQLNPSIYVEEKGEKEVHRQEPKMSEDEIELKKKTGEVKFREIIYNEGELDGSDLTKPPSKDNPHPFHPSDTLPPIYSRSIAPYVNHVPLLQTLVDLGVNLFEIDTTTQLSRHLLRLDSEKDVKPKLQWLVSIGLQPADLGDYLTRNPFFLIQNLDDMKARVNYLESKKFTSDNIVKIVKEFRYWLNVDVKTMDARLGWIQKQFALSGNEVRGLVVKEPRIVMFGLGPLQRLVNLFNKELLFKPAEIKKMLLTDPRLFMMDAKYITGNYHYVFRVMLLSNEIIAKNAFLLRCSLSNLRLRHEFLRKMGRATYEGQRESDVTREPPETSHEENSQPVLVKMEDLLHPDDAVFAQKAANTYLVVYEKYLRSR